MDHHYKVIQWATGQCGMPALRAIIEHPDLELVGLWVHSEEKAGQDAGTLCGTDPVGVTATNDAEALIDLEADCVCYMPTDLGREPSEIFDQVETILGSGKNVVASQALLGYTPSLEQDVVDRFQGACEKGSSSLYVTGTNPEVTGINLLNAASQSQNIQSLTTSEVFRMNNYEEPTLLTGFGFGLPPPTEVPTVVFEWIYGPMVKIIGGALGCEIQEWQHSHDFALADRDIELKGGVTVEKGTVAAIYHLMEGMVNGVPRLNAAGYYWVGDYPEGWRRTPLDRNGYRSEVRGTPDITVEWVSVDDADDDVLGAMLGVGARLANSIPAVCEAPTGLAPLLGMPTILPRVNW